MPTGPNWAPTIAADSDADSENEEDDPQDRLRHWYDSPADPNDTLYFSDVRDKRASY